MENIKQNKYSQYPGTISVNTQTSIWSESGK